MRLVPRSLFGQMMGLALATTLLALVVSGVIIGGVLERFVLTGIDRRLDAQIFVLARAVDRSGLLRPERVFDLPDFANPRSDWQWLVIGPNGERWSNDDDAQLTGLRLAPPRENGRSRPARRDRPVPGEAVDAEGRLFHFRRQILDRRDGPVTIFAAAPRSIVERPLRDAMTPFLLSLAALGAALSAAAYLQLRLGLRPIRALRDAVAEVRAGRRRDVPVDQPEEIRPLARELNTLIETNELGLANARRHVANLAHGLKTPLAALKLRLAEGGGDADGEMIAGLEDVDRRIRHHLSRARTASTGTATGRRTALLPAVRDLLEVMAKLHAEPPVAVRFDHAEEPFPAIDPQDLDELLGNVLDNAFRHARSEVVVTVGRDGPLLLVRVGDDGSGLDAAARRQALLPGWRLDEAGSGHGFGLPIAQEIAELYGGTLSLGRAESGGLLVEIRLPAAFTSTPSR